MKLVEEAMRFFDIRYDTGGFIDDIRRGTVPGGMQAADEA